jgi:hypothetical protein
MSGAVLRRVEPNAAGGGVIESVQLSAGGLEDRSQNLSLEIFVTSAGLGTPLSPRFAMRV